MENEVREIARGLVVSQEARELYIALLTVSDSMGDIRGGKFDNRPGMQRVARFEASIIERCAKVGWQDIATAPKDGSIFIGGNFNRDALRWVKHVRWMTADEACEACFDDDPADYEAGWSDGDDDPCGPTHWMPLPAPAIRHLENPHAL